MHAPFEHMRHTQSITNLANVTLAAIRHHTRATDHLQVRDLRQLGQNVVLNGVGKGSTLFPVTQVLEWEHCDSRRRRTLGGVLPKHSSEQRKKRGEEHGSTSEETIAPQPFARAGGNV